MVVRLHIGDLRLSVGRCEGPWALVTPVKANRAGVWVKIVLMPDLTRFVISIRSCGSQPRPHGELELLRGIGVRNHLLPERERELHGGLASGRSCQVPVALPAERQDHCHHRVHGHRPVPGEPKDCVQSVSDGFRVGRYWKQCSQIGKFFKDSLLQIFLQK